MGSSISKKQKKNPQFFQTNRFIDTNREENIDDEVPDIESFDFVSPKDTFAKIIETHPMEMFRFVIDGVKHQSVKVIEQWEEREKGSLKAIFSGLKLVMEFVNNPQELNSDFLKKLHYAATHGIAKQGEENKFPGVPGQYKTNANSFKLQGMELSVVAGQNATVSGIGEIIDGQNNANQYFSHEDKRIETLQHCGYLGGLSIEELNVLDDPNHDQYKEIVQKLSSAIDVRINDILNKYTKTIENAISRDAKLDAIVSCIRELEWAHPFMDGNCRTICGLFLNSLLMTNGFYPVIMDNPNHFDGLSKEQLIDEIKKGMENTQLLLSGKKVCDRSIGEYTREAEVIMQEALQSYSDSIKINISLLETNNSLNIIDENEVDPLHLLEDPKEKFERTINTLQSEKITKKNAKNLLVSLMGVCNKQVRLDVKDDYKFIEEMTRKLLKFVPTSELSLKTSKIRFFDKNAEKADGKVYESFLRAIKQVEYNSEFKKIVAMFIECGIKLNAKIDMKESVLIQAVKTGSAELVQMLLKNKADINSVSPLTGNTAIMEACFSGDIEMCKVLLECKPDYTIANKNRERLSNFKFKDDVPEENKKICKELASKYVSNSFKN